MRKGTVTGELKSILKELGVTYKHVFSDSYAPEGNLPGGPKRVGAKFCGVILTDSQEQVVKQKMEQKGFTFHFIRYNGTSSYDLNGTRFCFTKN